eukprot:scaffold262005_cov26-Tisochrysis_lutea.AAC.1
MDGWFDVSQLSCNTATGHVQQLELHFAACQYLWCQCCQGRCCALCIAVVRMGAVARIILPPASPCFAPSLPA